MLTITPTTTRLGSGRVPAGFWLPCGLCVCVCVTPMVSVTVGQFCGWLPSWQRTSSAWCRRWPLVERFQSEESVWAARIKLSAPLLQRLRWDLETQPKTLFQTVFTEQWGRGGRRHRTKSKKPSDNSSLLVLSVLSLWTRLSSVKVPIIFKFFLLCLKLLMHLFIFIPMLVWKGKHIVLTLTLYSVGLCCLLFSLLREEMFPVLINPVKSKIAVFNPAVLVNERGTDQELMKLSVRHPHVVVKDHILQPVCATSEHQLHHQCHEEVVRLGVA